MPKLKVLTYPNKILSTRAKELVSVTSEDKSLIRNMIETMHAEKGVGLAANQVGVLKRIFVATTEPEPGNEIVFINPKILKKEGQVKEFEGCLSIPEFYEPVKRAKRVWVESLDIYGKLQKIEATGLLSRIVQHELDHLDGILFFDRLGLFEKRKAKTKLDKKMRAY